VAVHAADVMTTSLLAAWIGSAHGLAVHAGLRSRPGSADDWSRVPSVAVLDLDHRDGDVLELASTLTGAHDAVVLIGHHLPATLVRRAVDAGVQGVTSKDVTIDELSAIIVRVAAGGTHVCPRLASAAITSATSPLTPRERQGLALCHQGASVAGIADQLHLAQGTVRNLLSAAVRKTGVAGRAAAASTARDRGWI
jgi:two-component system response regulator DesR